jgi:hypothetical protein
MFRKAGFDEVIVRQDVGNAEFRQARLYARPDR